MPEMFILTSKSEDSSYRLTLTVKNIQETCPVYEAGDQIVIEDFYIKTKESVDICIHAFTSMATLLSAFIHGTSAEELGIGEEKNLGYLQCPDPGAPYTGSGTVTFELRRERF